MRSYVGLYCKSNPYASRQGGGLKTPKLAAEINFQSLLCGFMPMILIIFFLSGCLRPPDTIKLDTIKDVRELPQNHASYSHPSYFKETSEVKDFIPAETMTHRDEDYNIIYFSVWHQHQPFHASPERV